MSLFSKLEDVLVQVIRVVLFCFAIFVLFGLASYLWERHVSSRFDEKQKPTVDWSSLKPDMKFVTEETGRDLGIYVPDESMIDRLTDSKLRPAFQQFDAAVRKYVAEQPAVHARVEKENAARGLAPLNVLLEADKVPTAEQIEAFKKQEAEREKAEQERIERLMMEGAEAEESEAAADAAAAATAAAVAAAAEAVTCCDSEIPEAMFSEPVDPARVLHERALQMQAENNDKDAYGRFVLGASEAMTLVLKDTTLQKKLREQSIARTMDMVLTNYSISFSRAISEANEDSSESLWDRLFSSIEFSLWSLILSFLVLVLVAIMSVRTERHMRNFLAGSRGHSTKDISQP